MKRKINITMLVLSMAWCATWLMYMLMDSAEYLREVSDMTPFYLTPVYYEQMTHGGLIQGIIHICACFLQASMAEPLWAPLLLTAVVLASGAMLRMALRVPTALAPLCWVPGVAVVTRFLGHSYDIYLDKQPGSLLAPLVWLVLVCLVLLALRVAFGRHAWQVPSVRWLRPQLAAVVLLLAGGAMAALRSQWIHTDANYRSILCMKHAADDGRWQDILQEALRPRRDADGQTLLPTRTQVMLTRLALTRLGRSGEDTYAYPEGDTPYAADTDNQYLRLIAGRVLYLHYGKVNYAYRWCMEDMVEYGERPDYILYMIRCSILNGEWALARRYARLLEANPFRSRQLAPLVALIGNPGAVQADADMGAIQRLMEYNTVLDGDGGHVEAYLLQSYTTMQGGTREMVRTSLDCALIQKDIAHFWPLFQKMLPVFLHEEGGRIPRHYQEAALLFAQLQGNVDISEVPIDDEIRQRFGQLIDASTRNAQMGDEYNARMMRPQYGDTYWYYYFFVTDLKTN